MSKPAPECAVGLVLYSIGRREGLEEGAKPGVHQVLKTKEANEKVKRLASLNAIGPG